MNQKIDYSDILKQLSLAKVQYVVIGGFAAIAHGVVRVTMDLDLAIAPEKKDYERAWDCLIKMGFVCRQPLSRAQFSSPAALFDLAQEKGMKAVSFCHSKQSYLVVDVLFEKEFQFRKNQTDETELFGVKCRVANISTLIELKKKAGRPKDLEDVRELEEIQKTSC